MKFIYYDDFFFCSFLIEHNVLWNLFDCYNWRVPSLVRWLKIQHASKINLRVEYMITGTRVCNQDQ
jgi:hypothetical protein